MCVNIMMKTAISRLSNEKHDCPKINCCKCGGPTRSVIKVCRYVNYINVLVADSHN